jgi:hypothetical protein
MVSVMSGASAGSPPQQKMTSLFDQIDSSGSGSISQAQFLQAFQTMNPPAVFQNQGADAIFSALDPSGSGSVSKPDFVSTMSKLMVSLRAENGGSTASNSSVSDTLTAGLQALDAVDPSTASGPGSFLNLTA